MSASDQASGMCKKCGQRPRSRTLQSNGMIVVDSYCGGSDCTVLPSVAAEFPISSAPTPAAVGNSDSVSIRPEDLRDPVSKTGKSKGKLPSRSVNLPSRIDEDDDGAYLPLNLEGPSDDDDLPADLPAVPPSLTWTSMDMLRFYDQTGPFFELSNYAPYPVTWGGKAYPTAEHLFQASKATEHIRRGGDQPQFAYNESRKWAPEIRPDWKGKSMGIMRGILSLKFTQHPRLQRLLLDTGDKFLVFNAGKDDDFWGNGAGGTGRNELGIALMRLRIKLRNATNVAL
ncbi:hypothetical protein M407DRAFT_31478 [Tulasnella calospora MUT 4182]|uniref:NADAR domain-containing protein n=1 Tax=Tulasnella calospora MUT 4182 TaxID=1051891 RepID=A0A0C3PVB5_9AGAM|nr:hypothetical protein M407DRAFT_31478 [Tulasnella calospora MUT 4182]